MKNNLSNQLLAIILLVFVIIVFILGFYLPKELASVYENDVYLYLKQPHAFLEENEVVDSEDIAIIYVMDNKILTSENFVEVIEDNPLEIISKIKNEYGKINVNDNDYYYYQCKTRMGYRITITNNKYVNRMDKAVKLATLPIIAITLFVTFSLLFFWSRLVVGKISKLKLKIDNIDNKDFNHFKHGKNKDELRDLEIAIENLRHRLLKEKEYKTNLLQNISHDLKTPVAVIKSYVEAINDKVETPKKGLKVIDEQVKKLEIKVKDLLYLNKLGYYEETIDFTKKIKLKKPILAVVENLKLQRTDIVFETDLDDSLLFGNKEIWEVIINNIVENAIRYAKKKIKITLKNNRVTIYNDGPKVDDKLLSDIFTPYQKGIKGKFGLGLTIVKRALDLLGYNIEIQNKKKGVDFIIK